jgi:paraquat-inducible protein A
MPHAHVTDNHTTACAECDLLIEETTADRGFNVICPRCGHVIREGRPDSVLNALILSVTGLILFVPAVGLPLLSMSILGLHKEASLIESILTLSRSGFWQVGLLVFVGAVMAPFLNLWLMFSTSLAIYLRHPSAWLRLLLRINHQAREWAMTEVFFLGVLVSVVKLKDLAKLLPDWGLWCFLCLMLISILLNSTVDEHELWDCLDHKHE